MQDMHYADHIYQLDYMKHKIILNFHTFGLF